MMFKMSEQKYKRTNFEEDNTSTGGTPPGVTYNPSIAFRSGATFWQKRTLLEKVLLVFCGALALIVLILGIIVGTTHPRDDAKLATDAPLSSTTTTPTPTPTPKAAPELCLTKPCVTVASSILNSLDESVDPCEDFYTYACGGWVKAHPIPSGQSRWGTFSVMDQDNQIIIRNELESALNKTLSEAERKAKHYYSSCLDPNKTVNALGPQPLLDQLKALGGWSLLPKVPQISDFVFQALVEKVHTLGMSTLFYMAVGEDDKNITANILQVDESGLGLARDQYLNKSIDDDKVLSAYLKYMTDIGVLLGADRNETYDRMRSVVEFEQNLANITTPMEERRDEEKLYNKMAVSKLQEIAPFLDWVHYLNNQLAVTQYKVDSDEQLLVYAPEYLTKLNTLLEEMNSSEEGQQVLYDYMMWHVSKGLCSYLSKPFQDAHKAFMEVITGVSGDQELWKYCTADTNDVLGFAVGAMFVRKTFHGESKNKAEEMIQGIKTAFKENLDNLSWMDKETRRAAIDKANAVVDMIGFPTYILNSTALDERYKKLSINESEYFMNNIRSMAYNIQRNLEKLRKRPDKFSWSMVPATVNAYYSPTKNEIVFPAGILQAPFFDQNFPKSINYGGMGVVMGHELTHGFDDQGREYDKTGVLRPWWNNASVERFKTQADCIVDQYSSYKINDDNIRGKQTLGENIADNGGLKASYHAYMEWVRAHGQERPLPGVNLSHKQLFFLSFAQVWCSNSKPESDHMGILTDPHSPSKFRVIGPLSNSRDFAQQWNCPAGSRMNPVDKCEVW